MTPRNLIIFLTLVFLGLAFVCPLAYGQMSSLPKYDPTLTLDPASPAPGASAHVTVHVSYFYFQQGKDPSVSNVYVRYSITGPSGEAYLPSATEGYTNAQGYQSADITIPSSPGDYTLNVYVYDLPGGEVFGQGAYHFTAKAVAVTPIAVTSTPVPSRVIVPPTAPPPVATPVQGESSLNAQLLLIIGAVVIVAILLFVLVMAVLAFLWTRRKLAVIPSATTAPCDGKSTIPITVKITNGLGMARKVNADTEVAMEATSGIVQNTVIWKGKDAAQTSLTASKEFGPVTITGKAGAKAARARISFTCAQAKFELTPTTASVPADGKSSVNINIKILDQNGNPITPLENLPIELKATLGGIPARVNMPARTGELNVTFMAGSQSGMAIVTASGGSMKGETRLIIESLSRRFCMHCGASMELNAPGCPKCGLTPPSGVDTKLCNACGTVIPEAAKFCHKCGAAQPGQATPPAQAAGDAVATKK
ncbi:MAG TPA: zinc ribbon domain-containing protein [Methanocella sp.]|nr:zinc ribbon domain-containing protein [Methanocella sp.]